MIPMDAARDELHHVIQELEGLQGRLLNLRQGLPPSRERPEDDLNADPDVSTEMGRVIECVLQDSIGPAVRDLLAAAEYRPGGIIEEDP
ncbi:MAG TPA: hypothetical protein VLQ45_00215 [Thermoanaerobaculia bacterium]|nr:hypothetical protein [Thermoanaerobaculia bacterium]